MDAVLTIFGTLGVFIFVGFLWLGVVCWGAKNALSFFKNNKKEGG